MRSIGLIVYRLSILTVLPRAGPLNPDVLYKGHGRGSCEGYRAVLSLVTVVLSVEPFQEVVVRRKGDLANLPIVVIEQFIIRLWKRSGRAQADTKRRQTKEATMLSVPSSQSETKQNKGPDRAVYWIITFFQVPFLSISTSARNIQADQCE